MSVRPLQVSQLGTISEKLVVSSVLPLSRNPSEAATILVISGPAGCGKTTIATHLTRELDIPFLEGDDFHSANNKAKMGRGVPLDDADRWDWLISLRKAAIAQLLRTNAVVLSCSALRRDYRDVIRAASHEHPKVQVKFINLTVGREMLEARVAARLSHYMKKDMVRSQLLTLEEPANDEFDVVTLDAQRVVEAVCEDARLLAIAAMKGASSYCSDKS